MMKVPIIAVTAGETINQLYPWSPPVQGQCHTYVDAVVHAGGAPSIVPMLQGEKALRALYEASSGLMLSGGNDLDPTSYGQKASEHTIDYSPERDKQELQLLTWALEDNKPVLGICRGMQLLNAHQGGTLYQDIVAELPKATTHNIASEKKRETRVVHRLRIKPDSYFADVMGGNKLGANAYHHQAIDQLGKGLIASAWAEDDIIEAIEMPSKRFVIGVQSHPESMEALVEPRWRKLFLAFVQASQEFAAKQQ